MSPIAPRLPRARHRGSALDVAAAHAARAARSAPRIPRAVALIALLLFSVGCTGVGGNGGSSLPSASASSSTTIDHATGATDLLLRVEQGGGFVPPGFLLTETPLFSLYGDRTLVFRDPKATPPPAAGDVRRGVPLRVARLEERQVQELLGLALGAGKLGIARQHYDPGTVADAGTTTFTVKAGGVSKSVSVVALGIAAPAGPDAVVVAALAALADRLVAFGPSLPTSQAYAPARYRAFLVPAGSATAVPWPWPAFGPADFVLPVDPARPRFPVRVLSEKEVAELGEQSVAGGLEGIVLAAPDGGHHGLVLRPLLPDEAS